MNFLRRFFPIDSLRGLRIRLFWWSLLPEKVGRLMHPAVIFAFARARKSVRFLQIGSNDAGYGDPIRCYIRSCGWQGILVEPVPSIYARLKENYKDVPGLHFENVAVDASSGHRTFYFLRPDADPSLPPWYDQIGSFLKEVVLKHENEIPDLRERLREVEVACETPTAICRRNGYDSLDVLHIDTEGYDLEILKSFDFVAFKPLLVMFEHKHLSDDDFQVALDCLRGYGYKTNSDESDTLGLLISEFESRDSVMRVWFDIRRRLNADRQASHAVLKRF